ncbi:hypothetical protein ACIQ57_20280 [Lysinibacillus xylanilyticus]|uniref:hypothetical protein n=1 Tax=Lysinibacillus xylanilyticus TaxID=582475 RepID=UPI003828A209
MNKRKVGNILGFISILLVIVCIVVFYIQRGPNTDIYFLINTYGILSILGILFAIFSWLMSKKLIFTIIGLIGNGIFLAFAYLLLLAMGIGEP